MNLQKRGDIYLSKICLPSMELAPSAALAMSCIPTHYKAGLVKETFFHYHSHEAVRALKTEFRLSLEQLGTLLHLLGAKVL